MKIAILITLFAIITVSNNLYTMDDTNSYFQQKHLYSQCIQKLIANKINQIDQKAAAHIQALAIKNPHPTKTAQAALIVIMQNIIKKGQEEAQTYIDTITDQVATQKAPHKSHVHKCQKNYKNTK